MGRLVEGSQLLVEAALGGWMDPTAPRSTVCCSYSASEPRARRLANPGPQLGPFVRLE